MHRWLPIAAPLTALALLTAACGVVDSGDPIPSVSPPGSPALKRVWQIPTKTVHPDGATAVGNVVLAPDAHDNGKTVFIDGTNGRIRGRAVTSPVRSLLGPATYATTDARGRPLVVIDQEPTPPTKQSVYDPDGHLVWKSAKKGSMYAGGYVAEPRKAHGKYVLVIHPPSGRTVARLPMPGYAPDLGIDFRAVRPGLLAVSGLDTERTSGDYDVNQIDVIDVSRPGPARVSRLSLPHAPAHNRVARVIGSPLRDVEISAVGGHLYAIWAVVLGGEMIARYDAPATRPVWQRTVPPDWHGNAEIEAYPGTIVIFNGAAEAGSDGFRFADPATGALTGPPNGWTHASVGLSVIPIAASDGLVYFRRSDSFDVMTDVIDPRKGWVRTINAAITGITSGGDLINGAGFDHVGPKAPHYLSALDAYRWR